ncbi:MAG: CapA family protein, partial [Oscillospiraceae bacterium]
MNKKYQKNAHQLHYKKRNNLKIKRIAIISALVLLVLGVIAFCIFKFTKKPVAPAINPNVESQTSSDESTSSSQEPVTPKLSKVRFISAGDNLIHDTVYSQAKQRAGGVGYDFKYAYENLESVFALADLKTLNQETVLSSAHKPSGYPMFNTPQENADYLIKLGFNVFNHATNHVLDKGVTGINSTLDYWKNHPDVLPTGVYANKDDAAIVQTITKNDITFAFLGMTESLNGLA